MQGHIRILAWLHIIFGAILAFAGLCFFFFLAGFGFVGNDRDLALVTGGIGLLIALVFLVMSVPSFFAGWGLLRYRQWARVLAIILAALHIFNFPFGTALGVYTFWALLSAESQPLFATSA